MFTTVLPPLRQSSICRPTHLRALSVTLSVLWAGSFMPACAQAQNASAATAPAPSDRSKHDAEMVTQWILVHSEKPRKARVDRSASPQSAALAASAARAPATVASALNAKAMPAPAPAAPSVAAAVQVSAAAAAIPQATSKASASAAQTLALSVPTAVEKMLPAAAEPPPMPTPTLAASAATPSRSLVLVSSVEAEFPAYLIRRLGTGSVVVKFEVLPDGSVGSTTVVKSSHRSLNDAAQAAVAAWRFKPVSEKTSGVTELRFE